MFRDDIHPEAQWQWTISETRGRECSIPRVVINGMRRRRKCGPIDYYFMGGPLALPRDPRYIKIIIIIANNKNNNNNL